MKQNRQSFSQNLYPQINDFKVLLLISELINATLIDFCMKLPNENIWIRLEKFTI